MYRSFITCDDSKGVVECGTIRKSKIASQKMEDKINSQRKQKKSDTSMAHKAKKEEIVSTGIVEDNHNPSSFQLLEVSRGAQKLNHVIDSWSKGLSFDGQSKDIAKELLKGALDLQDSLTMLGKLQEASQYMAQLKKKQKDKSESRRIDETGSEKTNSHRFEDQNHQLGFQKPRISADGYSKDCIEELRNAIKDGLARQNLLQNTHNQKKKHFDRRKMDLISDIPSTSTSKLSPNESTDIHSTSSSKSEEALQKGKGPNLIAKLMGLEDIPSKPLMQPPEEQLGVEKNLTQRRELFDIEMPKLRKPQPVMQKLNWERKTLKELLASMQFHGLLQDGSAKELKSHSHQSSDIHSEERLINQVSPIVLIKPLRVPCLESEEAFSPWEERALNTKMMMKKMKIKERFASRLVDDREGTSNGREVQYCREEADETPIEKVIQEEGANNQIEKFVMPEEKEVITIDKKEESVMATNVNKKLEAEQAPMKRFSHEEREKFRGAVSRAEEKEIRKNLKDSSKMKGCNPTTQQQQGKQMTDKKADKIQKVAANSRKPLEREATKTKNVSRNQNQVKMTSAKLKKPDNLSIITNDHSSQQRTTTRKNNSKLTTRTTTHNLEDRKQKEKQATEYTAAQPITDNLECKEDEKRIDLTCRSHSVAEQLSMEEEANASKFQTEEHYGDNQSSICVVTVKASEYKKNPKSSKEADDQRTCITSDERSFKSKNQLKILLLSTPSFLNLADELFHLDISYSNFFPTSGICDLPVTTEIKVFLDYANEFIERRSLQDSQTRHPLLPDTRISRIHLSLDQLVEEVCSGDETLRSYHNFTCENLHIDFMYATLEKDMKCKGVVTGTWDLGWRNGFSVEEVEQAVNDLEKLIVSELIEEVFF